MTCEIRIRAERRLGEMLAATKASGRLNQAATLKRGPVVATDDHGKVVRSSPTTAPNWPRCCSAARASGRRVGRTRSTSAGRTSPFKCPPTRAPHRTPSGRRRTQHEPHRTRHRQVAPRSRAAHRRGWPVATGWRMTPKLPSAARMAEAADTVMQLARFIAQHHQHLQQPAAVVTACAMFGALLSETAQGLRDGKTDAQAFEQASAQPIRGGPTLQSTHPAMRLAEQLVDAAEESFTGDIVLCARVIGPPSMVNEPALLVEFADGFHTHYRRDAEPGEAFRSRVAAEMLARPRCRGPYGNLRLLLELPGVAGKTSAQVLDAPEGVQ